MLRLLSVHVTSVLFLVRFNNFTASIGFTRAYSSRPFLCALVAIEPRVLLYTRNLTRNVSQVAL